MATAVRVREWLAGEVLTAVALNAEFDNLINFVNAEEALLNTAQSNITTLQGDLTTLDGRVDTAETDITTVEGQIAALEADVTATALTRVIVLKVLADTTVLTTGDGKTKVTIPVEFNGMDLVSVGAHVYTASTAGTPTIQIYNATQAADMLSTRVTIDANEKDSSSAATPAVIDAANDDVATGDELRIDVDVAGTNTTGLEVRMGFRLP